MLANLLTLGRSLKHIMQYVWSREQENCVIFDHNTNSGHCYLRDDDVWAPKPNPHVVSYCMPAKVPACGQL